MLQRIEENEHLFRCLVYIDLNMVRAGVVDHPSKWPFGGYNEIQKPRRKNILIDYEKLLELVNIESYELLKQEHKGWVENALAGRNSYHNGRDDKWPKSIAVGSKSFVEDVKSALRSLALGREAKESGDGYQLRESPLRYGVHFGVRNENIEVNNSYLWGII